MTESERVARELLAYRDNPPVRQAGLVEGQWYESGDILWIIMAPRCEFTTHELLTRLAELMLRGACHIVKTWSDSDYVDGWRYRCSECMCFIPVNERDPETGDVISAANFCPNCGRKVEA